MSNIPHARKILEQLMKDLAGFETDLMHIRASVKAALHHMYRDRHKPIKGKRTSSRMTATLRDQIKSMCRHNPEMHTRDVAEKLNINQGRVTEVLAGKYDELS